jgi:Fe-S oxidoreductase
VRTTRQPLAGLGHWQIVLWYGLAAVSTAIFLLGVVLLARKYRAGCGAAGRRTRRSVAAGARRLLTHSTIGRRDPFVRAAHALVFYGFVVLFLGTVVLAVEDDLAKPLGWDFWHGGFYLGYSLVLDVFGAALTSGVLAFGFTRLRRPPRLSYRRVDGRDESARSRYVIGDWVFLTALLVLAVSGFVLEALRVAETMPPFERWSPCGWVLARGLRSAGVGAAGAADAHLAVWWLHGIVALLFVAAIPFTKAVHLLVDPVGLTGGPPVPGARLEGVPDRGGTAPGYGFITDLTPKHLLDLDACTKCGRCHAVCPATATGLPLSPRDLILDLREHAEGALGARHALRIGPPSSTTTSLEEVVPSPTVWSCMQCLACVEACPVGVEHVPIIVDLRRRRVDSGDLDAGAQSALEAIYESGNSFGLPRRRRGRWVDELSFTPRDARNEAVDVLWFVGDYASLDARNQRATRALAETLHRAGVDFGILYDGEQNAGNDVRRVGEEVLFLDLAEKNIETIDACAFRRILTTDPHTYNTLKNDYPALGGSWPVLHHAELLLELFADGSLEVRRQLALRATYHDPCALGRANGVYDPPRRVLETIGCELVEMPRNRANSFCCGAGGGRIWMNEVGGRQTDRPAEARIREAAALDAVEVFVVACPKDVVMYEDAIKTSGHEGRMRLAELSELVLASLEPDPVPGRLVPLS